MGWFDRWADRGCRAIDALMVACLALMVVMVFGNVVLRYAFNSGITVSEELSRWLFIWMTFLGATVAVREHGHLGTDMLVSRLGPAGKRVCLLAGHALMLWMNWLLFTGSLAQTRINAEVEAPVTGWPMAIVYASGMVFSAVATVFTLREAWRALTGQLSEDDLVGIRESEEVGAAHGEERKP